MTFDITKARNDMIARILTTHPVPFGVVTNGLECEHNAKHIAEIGNAVCDYLESLLAEAASSMTTGQTDDESVSYIREAINDLADILDADGEAIDDLDREELAHNRRRR